MHQNEYELVTIIRPDLDDAKTYEIVEKIEAIITDNGGSILIRDDWGKRKLAYSIQKNLKGHYVLITFLSTPDLIAELERRIRITDAIIRFLTVRKAESVDVAVRLEQATEQRRLRDEEKARLDAARAAEQENDEDDDDDDDEDNMDEARL